MPLRDPIVYKIMDYEVSLPQRKPHMVVVITNEEGEGLISEEYNGTREGDQAPMRSSPKVQSGSTSHWWVTRTAARPRCSTLFQAVTNTSATTAASRWTPNGGHCTYRGYRFEIIPTCRAPTHSRLTRPKPLRTPPFGRTYAGRNYQCRRKASEPGTQPLPHYRTHRPESPVVVALNMYDELEASGAELDYDSLGRNAGCADGAGRRPSWTGVSKPCWTR